MSSRTGGSAGTDATNVVVAARPALRLRVQGGLAAGDRAEGEQRRHEVAAEAIAAVNPADLAARLAAKGRATTTGDYKRTTFRLPRTQARAKARELLDRYPPAASKTAIESWAELAGDVIEFTIRRLPSAD